MLNVDRINETDLESLAVLYRQFWNEPSSLEKMRETFKRLDANKNYVLLGAKTDDRLVGSAMGIICEELYGDCRPFMVVEDVVVDRDHRRRGIGARLMRALEEQAKDQGCGTIILVTEADRTDAHHFYASLGYPPDRYKGFKKRLKRT
jgi:GNAT superfamily N-acetyltransferase